METLHTDPVHLKRFKSLYYRKLAKLVALAILENLDVDRVPVARRSHLTAQSKEKGADAAEVSRHSLRYRTSRKERHEHVSHSSHRSHRSKRDLNN
eukprot:scaffold37347_cov38-Prasinocladus_malaysianus.AAC.1